MLEWKSASWKRAVLPIMLFVVLLTALLSAAIWIQPLQANAAMSPGWTVEDAGNPTGMSNPYGMAVDPVTKSIFVTSSDHSIRLYTPDGAFEHQYGTLGTGDNQLNNPLSLLFDGQGYLYISDAFFIRKFQISYSDSAWTFTFIAKWNGTVGDDPVGEIVAPQDIALDGNTLYIADTMKDRILKIENADSFSQTSPATVWDVEVTRPVGLEIDSEGIYVSEEATSGKISKFTRDGELLYTVGGLYFPHKIQLASDGYLYGVQRTLGLGGGLIRHSLDLSSRENVNGGVNYDYAYGIAIDEANGALYVSDAQSHKVVKYTTGTFNNKLTGLTLSAGNALTPSFDSETYHYATDAENAIESLTVTPVAAAEGSTIHVNNTIVASGDPSEAIGLDVGSNTITVDVYAGTGGKRTYTITVTRAEASSNAYLSGLSVSTGALNEAFAPETTTYTHTVANHVTSLTVTPTAADTAATITVNEITVASGDASEAIPLDVFDNTVTVKVTAQDGVTEETYTLIIARAPSANADLSGLAVSTGDLEPEFDAGTLIYEQTAAYHVREAIVTPTSADNTATVTVNGDVVVSGNESAPLVLAYGNNRIEVEVTAQNGTTTRLYTITILRQSPPPAPQGPSTTIWLGNLPISPDAIDTTKPSITLEVTPVNGMASATLPVAALLQLAERNDSFLIEIKAPYGSYRIPVHLAALIPGLKELLAQHSLSEEYVSFKIHLTDKSGEPEIGAAFEQSLPYGRVAGAIVDFTIEIVNSMTGQTIGQASRFTQAITRMIPLPRELSELPKHWGAFRYDEAGGAFGFVPAKPVQIDGVWYILIASRTNSVYAIAENRLVFSDVADTHWGKSAIELAAAKGLVNGIGNEQFAPSRTITRGEFAAMLDRALGKDGSYVPDKEVLTREEMASMLAQAIHEAQGPVSDTNTSILAHFTDLASLSPSYADDVSVIVELGIMKGTGAAAFDPQGSSTRAQAATVLIRLLQALEMIE